MKRKIAAVLALVLLILTLGTSPASAHTGSTYYPKRWVTKVAQDWFFTATFPTGDWRARVRNGASQWNGVNQPMKFTEVAQRSNFDPYKCPPTYGTNGIHWRNYDGRDGALAITGMCSTATELYSTNLTFDSSEDWYTGTGDAPDGFQVGTACVVGPCKVDAWSVASHEWGHMTGFDGPYDVGHFSRSEAICADDGGQHTMCPSIKKGTERQRTLETHDRHTFDAAY